MFDPVAHQRRHAVECGINLAISLHRLAGATNVAQALRHHSRDALLKID